MLFPLNDSIPREIDQFNTLSNLNNIEVFFPRLAMQFDNCTNVYLALVCTGVCDAKDFDALPNTVFNVKRIISQLLEYNSKIKS